MKTKPARYRNLFLQIAECKPTIILEIGTWKGDHAKQMIEEALKYQKKVHYIGFDLFEEITDSEIKLENSKKDKANFLEVLSKLEKMRDASVRLIVGNTKETLRNTPGQPIDFIFIDGGHSLDTIASDWSNLQKYITPKTVIIFDDYYPEDNTKGCKKTVDSLNLDKWNLEFLDPIDEFDNNFKVQMVKVMKK